MDHYHRDQVKYSSAAETPESNGQIRRCGGATLVVLLACITTFIISFTTSGWDTRIYYNGWQYPYSRRRASRTGLWESCGPILQSK